MKITTNTSPPRAPDAPTKRPIGMLWTTTPSPLCATINIVLHLSGVTVNQAVYIPFLTPMFLWFRHRINYYKLQPPLLRTPTKLLHETFTIAHHIDHHRRTPQTLFPAEHVRAIESFSRHARNLNNLMKANLSDSLRSNTLAATNVLVPSFLQNTILAAPLARLLALLYTSFPSDAARVRGSRTAARKALQAARRALAAYTGDNLRYLCGTHLTFADVIFAECVFFDRDAYGTWGELVKDEELAELFPDVVVWASAIRGTHYADIQGNMGA